MYMILIQKGTKRFAVKTTFLCCWSSSHLVPFKPLATSVLCLLSEALYKDIDLIPYEYVGLFYFKVFYRNGGILCILFCIFFQ